MPAQFLHDTEHDTSAAQDLDTSVSDSVKSRTLSDRILQQSDQQDIESFDVLTSRQLYATLERICNSPEHFKAGEESKEHSRYNSMDLLIWLNGVLSVA